MVAMRFYPVVLIACLTALASAPARAQSDAAPAEPVVRVDEEIIVRGVQPGRLRDMIEEAEVAVYDRFNEINSDDKFDIHCYLRREIGSKMLRRRCLPNYWKDADAIIGEETARSMQGSFALETQSIRSEAFYNGQLLAREMRRLTEQDEELMAATVHLVSLQETLAASKRIRQAANETLDRAVDPDSDAVAAQAAAEAVVQVRVGRKPWTHALSNRTFTIARVYGEIRDLELECEKNSMKLEHEPGVEWSVPESWGECTVVVDAARDTTFALYEFS